MHIGQHLGGQKCVLKGSLSRGEVRVGAMERIKRQTSNKSTYRHVFPLGEYPRVVIQLLGFEGRRVLF